jgi:hypothetical protein
VSPPPRIRGHATWRARRAGSQPGHPDRWTGVRRFPPIYPLACISVVLALSGCGSGGALTIAGSRSFAGVPNGGTLRSAMRRFGTPTRIYSPNPSGQVDCVAEWSRYGVQAIYQDFADAGDGEPCAPAGSFRLASVTLHGHWSTDTGLTLGDTVSRMSSLYPHARPRGCATDQPPSGVSWSLSRVADPLGGPGAFICTLAAVASHGRIVAFMMSNLGASE